MISANEIVSGSVLRKSPLPGRFDTQLLGPHIDIAMRKHVIPVLGREMYDDLVEKKDQDADYATSTPAFTDAGEEAYEALYQAILQQFCAEAVIVEAIPYIGLTIANNGVVENINSLTQGTGVRGVQFMQDTASQRLLFLRKELIDFLCEHKEDYPLWDDENYCSDCADGNNAGANFGILFY